MDWIESRSASFPLKPMSQPPTPANNQATLQNVRLWDWRALQDTLVRSRKSEPTTTSLTSTLTAMIDGTTRQVMLAARELNIEKLPESSRQATQLKDNEELISNRS